MCITLQQAIVGHEVKTVEQLRESMIAAIPEPESVFGVAHDADLPEDVNYMFAAATYFQAESASDLLGMLSIMDRHCSSISISEDWGGMSADSNLELIKRLFAHDREMVSENDPNWHELPHYKAAFELGWASIDGVAAGSMQHEGD